METENPKTLLCIGGPLDRQYFTSPNPTGFQVPATDQDRPLHKAPNDGYAASDQCQFEIVEYESWTVVFTPPGQRQFEREYWMVTGMTDKDLFQYFNKDGSTPE